MTYRARCEARKGRRTHKGILDHMRRSARHVDGELYISWGRFARGPGRTMRLSAAFAAGMEVRVVMPAKEALSEEAKGVVEIIGPSACVLCGKPLAYPGAVYCGAACCAAWEMGKRP